MGCKGAKTEKKEMRKKRKKEWILDEENLCPPKRDAGD